MKTQLYYTIAQDLEEKIRSGIFPENTRLPSERELLSEYHVSRTVIREALKILIEKNLVKNHPGKGNYVCHPCEDSLGNHFESFMDFKGIPLSDLVDAREELEIIIGKRAIQHVSCKTLKELEHLYQKMEENINDNVIYNEYDFKFHLKLADCSQNETLKILFSSFYSITGKNIFSSVTNKLETRKHAQLEHYNMLCALKTRSPRNLTKAIQSHMNCIKEHIDVLPSSQD